MYIYYVYNYVLLLVKCGILVNPYISIQDFKSPSTMELVDTFQAGNMQFLVLQGWQLDFNWGLWYQYCKNAT
jgi:hypothetical protein